MTPDDLAGKLFASTKETAAILDNADPRTIRRMIADDTIPARKNGCRYIAPVAWLREFVGTPGAAPAPAAPDYDELAERVADRVIARLGRLLAAMAAADMTAAGMPLPAAKLDSQLKDRRRDHDTPAA